ncbi:hypothetical protein CLOP_g19942 [Closterium sp. NIES-67]|nr:hypothetical protein CLOP_g19942 [Closterium sp. NIES-67]
MGDKEDSGGGDTSVQGGSSTQDSGIAAQRGARTSQGSLLEEVLKNFTIEKFFGDGYDDWAWKMQLYFRQIGLLKLMIGTEPRPKEMAERADWDERSSAGYYLLSQSLELNQRHHIMHLLPETDCGPKAWAVLKDLHAPTSVAASLMLDRELSMLRLSENEPVQPVMTTPAAMPCKGHGEIEGVAIAVALTTTKVVAGLGTSGGVVALVQEEEVVTPTMTTVNHA